MKHKCFVITSVLLMTLSLSACKDKDNGNSGEVNTNAAAGHGDLFTPVSNGANYYQTGNATVVQQPQVVDDTPSSSSGYYGVTIKPKEIVLNTEVDEYDVSGWETFTINKEEMESKDTSEMSYDAIQQMMGFCSFENLLYVAGSVQDICSANSIDYKTLEKGDIAIATSTDYNYFILFLKSEGKDCMFAYNDDFTECKYKLG